MRARSPVGRASDDVGCGDRKAGVGDFILVSDIEGAEAGMFDRDADALTRCRRMIVELHESTYGARSTSAGPD